MSVQSRGVDDLRDRLDHTLGGPEPLTFPDGWTCSTSWHRAQACRSVVGSVNPLEWDVLLGRLDDDGLGDRHRVLLAIHNGDAVAECDCHAWEYHQFCSHVALLWWRWSRARLSVLDVSTGRDHLEPPWWLSVGGEQ